MDTIRTTTRHAGAIDPLEPEDRPTITDARRVTRRFDR
jgi:hypothetical protein